MRNYETKWFAVSAAYDAGVEARAKLTTPLSREQRKALIESAINAADEEGLLPDMERFAWMIDAVERAHGISSATCQPPEPA